MTYNLYNTIVITKDGNIGIGTDNPVSSLDLSQRQDGLIIPKGSTSQRPSFNNIIRFNTDVNNLEFNVNNAWLNLTLIPTITSVSTNVLKNANDIIDVSGTNFDASANFTFIDNFGRTFFPKQVSNLTFNSVRLMRPDWFPVEYAPYTIKVSQGGRYNTYGGITAGVIPSLNIASGSLGTFESATTITPIVITATDESGGGIIIMDISNGSLPSGLTGSFTSSGTTGTYTITGTTATMGSTTTYPFTLRVIDSGYNQISQNYSITVNAGNTLYNSFTTATANSVLVAYSLRKVRNAYTGPVVRIRRSTDSSENDFYGDTLGVLTNILGTTLSVWLGGGTGFVRTWYDQSGAGRHATQTTTGYQPQINLTQFTYPTVHFNSASQTDAKFLTIAGFSLTAPFTFIFLSRKTRSGRWIAESTGTPNTLVGYYDAYEAAFYMDNSPGNGTGNTNTVTRYTAVYNSDYIHMAAKSTTKLEYYSQNGYIKHSNVAGTATNFGSNIILGGGGDASQYGAGYFMELTVHNIVIPITELDSIQTNIATFYNISTTQYNNVITSGLQLYLDMNNSTSYSSGTAWNDLSGQAKNFTFSGTPTVGTESANNNLKYWVTSGGSGGVYGNGPASNTFNITNTTGYTIFYVAKTMAAGAYGGGFKFRGTGHATNAAIERAIFVHPVWSDNNIYYDQGGCCNADSRTSVSIASYYNKYSIYAFRCDITNVRRTIWADGILLTTNTNAIANINMSSGAVQVGGNTAPDAYTWNARFSTFIVYNRPLSDNEVIHNCNLFRARYLL